MSSFVPCKQDAAFAGESFGSHSFKIFRSSFLLFLQSFDTLIFVCVQAAAVQDRDSVLRDIEILKHNMNRADEIAMDERNRRIDAAAMSDRLQQEVVILKDAAAGNVLNSHPKVSILNEKMSCSSEGHQGEKIMSFIKGT